MTIAKGTKMNGFLILDSEDVPEIDGTAYIGTHEESGARLLILANDDTNKSFAIGFRTPPNNDTGVFHILEHSVLCGSDKFPVKEPFVNLLKSSMQTFLNAMTFPDKTLYPVASTNDQDLLNLMDVYLDAVFHPQIYRKRTIFEQEGWHQEIVEEDSTAYAVFNGVVYNEMKGGLSDANSVLFDHLQAALFPDTCYTFESGGTPEAIPTLSYEEFLNEHKRHYRTDNSYIVLYGNLDIEHVLAFLDETYLSPVAQEQRKADAARLAANEAPYRPRTITAQHPLQAGYHVHRMDTAPENACAAIGSVIGSAHERVRIMAADILLDALFGSNESPLKRTLLDAGIATEISAYVADSVLQPYAVVQLNMPTEDAGKQLQDTLSTVVSELLEKGLDHTLIEASLARAEFQAREHEMGVADGVALSMMSLASWLYDDNAPLDYIHYEHAFAQLKDALETTYFEDLCKDLFLTSKHTAAVEVIPSSIDCAAEIRAELNSEEDAAPAPAPASASAPIAPQEINNAERERISQQVEALRQAQEAPDTAEQLATLPRLSRTDVGDAPTEPTYDLDWRTPITCLRHSVPTHGITYAYRYFDVRCISFEEIPYIALLSKLLGKLDTQQHTAAQLDTLIQGKLGNLSFYLEIYENATDPFTVVPKFIVSSSALAENTPYLATLPVEILTQTDFSNHDKIFAVLQQLKIAYEQGFVSAGHTCATARAQSYCSAAGVLREQSGNVGFYKFLCDLIENYETRASDLTNTLTRLAACLFHDDGCTVSFAGDDAAYDAFWLAHPGCGKAADNDALERLVIPKPQKKNEAFIVPSDVCYAALTWDRRLLQSPFTGSWLVAARVLSYDYLWNEVRVKGGAYGAGFQARRAGLLNFYSYRDPHLDETIARFAESASWLDRFEPSPEDMDGFVVATIAGLDAPLKPRAIVRRQAADYFKGMTPALRATVRKEALATTNEDLQSFASIVAEVGKQQAICAFGNRDILQSSQLDLEVIELF